MQNMNYFCLWLCEMWTGHSAGTMLLSADCNVCVSASGLSVVLFSVTQEELLNRLMVFGTAGTVDSLCHLNAWGRCSIPIHALQVQTHSTCDASSYIHLSSVLKVLLHCLRNVSFCQWTWECDVRFRPASRTTSWIRSISSWRVRRTSWARRLGSFWPIKRRPSRRRRSWGVRAALMRSSDR